MLNWSLRAKLTACSALIVGVVMVLTLVGTAVFIHSEQIEALDDQLQNEAKAFFMECEREGVADLLSDPAQINRILPAVLVDRYVEVHDSAATLIYSSTNLQGARLPVHPEGLRTVTVDGHSVRLGVFRHSGVVLSVAADLHEIDGDTGEVLLAFLLATPLFLGTAAFGGWWLSRKALAPIGEIAAEAEQIRADRLDHRLHVPRVGDEVERLANVLNSMLDRLDRSFRQASRFSADASHELKTPLTLLRVSAEELLSSPTLGSEDQQAVANILEQTQRLSSITESLLLLARADADRLKLDVADQEITGLLRACIDDASIMAEEDEISITLTAAPSIVAPVDAERFNQIMLILLDNAVKYNVTRGRVVVDAESGSENLRISVANTGHEIPADRVPRLFERFARGDDRSAKPGSGLGLSLARELAKAHGGSIEFVPGKPGWNVFELRLPITAASEEAIAVEELAAS